MLSKVLLIFFIIIVIIIILEPFYGIHYINSKYKRKIKMITYFDDKIKKNLELFEKTSNNKFLIKILELTNELERYIDSYDSRFMLGYDIEEFKMNIKKKILNKYI